MFCVVCFVLCFLKKKNKKKQQQGCEIPMKLNEIRLNSIQVFFDLQKKKNFKKNKVKGRDEGEKVGRYFREGKVVTAKCELRCRRNKQCPKGKMEIKVKVQKKKKDEEKKKKR